MTKIWTKIKPIDINPFVESYTVGDDNLLDENMRFINFTGRGLTESFDILSGLKPMPKLK